MGDGEVLCGSTLKLQKHICGKTGNCQSDGIFVLKNLICKSGFFLLSPLLRNSHISHLKLLRLGALVTLWVNPWPTDLVVQGFEPHSRQNLNCKLGSFATAFLYHLSIVLI